MEILNKSSLHPTIFSRNDAYALLMTKDLFFSPIYLNVCVSCWEMIELDCGCTPHMTLFQTFCLVVDIYERKTDIKSKRLVKKSYYDHPKTQHKPHRSVLFDQND